jgi:hypothetical protein
MDKREKVSLLFTFARAVQALFILIDNDIDYKSNPLLRLYVPCVIDNEEYEECEDCPEYRKIIEEIRDVYDAWKKGSEDANDKYLDLRSNVKNLFYNEVENNFQ